MVTLAAYQAKFFNNVIRGLMNKYRVAPSEILPPHVMGGLLTAAFEGLITHRQIKAFLTARCEELRT